MGQETFRYSLPPSSGRIAVTREEIEAREDAVLGPWAMRSAHSQGRAHAEPPHPYRSAYMRDRDRIVHTRAFRSLEYKTQVFVNHEGDYYRTRLTHTMEVAQVARTAARALRLNEDLTESIALSHDLGHGPFGHKGEYVLRELMQAHGGFEHNAHGLRVVDLLERRYPRWRGINLSYEVREAFALHSPSPKGPLGFREGIRPLLEAQLVDTCDSLAYLAHDLDDGITAGFVEPEALREVELWRQHWERVQADEPTLARRQQALLTVKRIIDASVGDLITATAERIAAVQPTTPAQVQAHPHLIVAFHDDMHRMHRRLSHYLYEHFYNSPPLMKMGHRARRFLTGLFEAYRENPRLMEAEERAWADEVGLERAICDKIASMTDREAQEEYRRLFEPFERI
ncbi:MAG: deoxyguanosinetriphosphate triphosphohydrolase [Planctomycetia bacterium]